MKRFFADPTRVIFFGTFALLIAANHAFFFVTPWHENGDFALNALQVERAKHLNEFYGNYSRFHFNHPGPAFFYVYAAGEFLLHDWLQVVPTPHNAHALAGTALQVLFFAIALGVAAHWVQRRWFVPLALCLAGIHFSLAQHAFTSVWPPYVLLMPFLCFVIASASVAAGQPHHVALAVIAGSFLVHGHVAQPLLVGLIFIVAYAVFWWRQRAESGTLQPWKRHRLAHALAAAALAVFLVPLAVDLSLGAESNLAQIWQFTLAKKEHRTLLESAVYLLSFPVYLENQEHFIPERGAIDFSFLRERIATYAVWAVVVAAGLRGTWRLRRRAPGEPATQFLSALLVVLGAGLIAVLLWGVLQTGPMFAFNAHFVHALFFGFPLVAAALVAIALPERGAVIATPVLVFIGGAMLWNTTRLPESTDGAQHSWFAATARALESDPEPGRTKLLVFSHDDWGDVARTALALKRLGESYRVDQNWRFMFGRYRTLGAEELRISHEKFSIWRFSRHALQGRSAPLEDGLRVYFDPIELPSVGTVIDCRRGGNLEQVALFGFTSPDENFSWTNLPGAALQFRSAAVEHDIIVTIDAEPFAPHLLGSQPMHLTLNDRKIASFELAEAGQVSARIPAGVWNAQPLVTMVLDLPSAASPRQLGISIDPRMLGWGISRIAFTRAP